MNGGKIYLIAGIIALVLAGAGYLLFSGSMATMEHGDSTSAHQDSSTAHGQANKAEPAPDAEDSQKAVVLKGPGYKEGEKWEKVSGEVPVKLAVSDQVEKVEFYLTDQRVQTKTERPFAWTLDTTQYEDCMYTLRVVAYNAAGEKLGEDRSRIWIDNTPDNCM